MTDLQKSKRNYRNSKEWKNFRREKNVKQGGKDPITGSKLGRDANLHHRFVTANEEEYKNLENKDDYVLLGRFCHKALHWLYNYWKKDPLILERIEEEFRRWH